MSRLGSFWLSIFFLSSKIFVGQVNDDCINAISLCKGITYTGTTIDATMNASDPAITCGDQAVNNSVWYKVDAWAIGAVKLEILGIDNFPGLEVQIYEGSCGALSNTGFCNSGFGPSGSISLIFPVVANTSYYILVDGTMGNEEDFSIRATIAGGSAYVMSDKPKPLFQMSGFTFCSPAVVNATNYTMVNGINTTYTWKIWDITNNTTLIENITNSTGVDTIFSFPSAGLYQIELISTNECGSSNYYDTVSVQEVQVSFAFDPDSNLCMGKPIQFITESQLYPPFPSALVGDTSWIWNFDDINAGPLDTSLLKHPVHSFAGTSTGNPEIFDVSLTVFGKCGPVTYSEPITFNYTPYSVANISPEYFCKGDTEIVILDGSGSDQGANFTSLWMSNSNAPIADSSLLLTSSVTNKSTIYQLTISDTTGCSSTVSQEIAYHKPAIAEAVPSGICTSDPPPFEPILSVTGAGAGSVYQWYDSPDYGRINDSNGDSSAITFLLPGVAGIYNFTVIIDDSNNGCRDTIQKEYIVVDSVQLSVTPDTSICVGDSLILAAAGAMEYIWPFTFDTSQFSLVSPPLYPGVHVYVVQGFVGGCSKQEQITVYVGTPIEIDLPQDLTVCSNYSTSIVASGGSEYFWSSVPADPSLIGQEANDTITVFPSDTTEYFVTVRHIGCEDTTSVVVSTIPSPIVTASIGLDTICLGDTTSITVTGGHVHNWIATPSDPSLLGQQDTSFALISPASPTMYFSYGTDTLTGCISVDSIELIVNQLPPVNATATADTLCVGDTSLLVASGTDLYTWAIDSTPSNIIANVDSFSVFPLTTSCYILEGTDIMTQCINTDIQCVIVSQYPSVVLNELVSDSICQNEIINITGNGSNLSNIIWDTSPTSAGYFSPSNGSLNSTFIADSNFAGNAILRLTAGNYPCPDTIILISIYIKETPKLQLSVSDTTMCFGDTIAITTMITGLPGPFTYQWQPTGGSDQVAILAPSDTSIYTVQVTSNINGCTSSDTVNINIIPPGTPFAGYDDTICIGEKVNLNGEITYATSVEWTTEGSGAFEPNGTILSPSYTPSVDDILQGTVQLFLSSTDGCYNQTDTLLLHMLTAPIVDAGPNQEISMHGNVILRGVPIELDGDLYNISGGYWSTNGTGVFEPNNLFSNETFYFPSREDYELNELIFTLVGIGSCDTRTDESIVTIVKIFFPNVITPMPASPGWNDVFKISGLPNDARIIIYNRWGERVYESLNYDNSWDGGKQEDGTYYYILTYKELSWTGFIQIIGKGGK